MSSRSLNWKRSFFLFLSIILILLCGSRDISVGTDTHAYEEIFNYPIESFLGAHLEPGWIFITYVVKMISDDFHLFKFVISLLTLGFFCLGVLKYKKCGYMWPLFVYYSMYAYLNSYNGMRQFLALSIVFFAYTFLLTEQKKRFIVTVLIATTIHYSAIYSIVVLFHERLKLSKNQELLLLAVSFLFGCIVSQETLSLLAGSYGKSETSMAMRNSNITAIVVTLLLDYLYFAIKRYFKRFTMAGFSEVLFLKIFFIGIILNNLTFKLTYGSRMILYFTIIQCFLFPFIVLNRKKIDRNLNVLIFLYLAAVFFKCLILGNVDEGGVIPYKSILIDYVFK